MGDRRSYGWFGGPRSPFLSANNASASNLSNHFEYIDADEGLYGGGDRRPSIVHKTYRVGEIDDDPEAPDQILVNHMGDKFSIEFDPYSISEEKVTVRDLRRRVAERIRISPERVRLIYKGSELKRNPCPLRNYGLKQNSEVYAIVADRPRNYEQEQDSASDSGSDSGSARRRHQHQQPPPQQPRPRSISSVRYRGDEPLAHAQTNGNGYLSPTGYVPASAGERHSRDFLRPSEAQHRDSTIRRDRSVRRDREPSPSRRAASPARAPSRAPSSSPASSSTRRPAPAADPNTPLGKVQTLVSTLRTTWIPQCNRFIAGPPADPDVRKKEYLKLSESVMQLIDKADAIELEGNSEARASRKELINEANAVIKKLDAVPS